MCPAKFFHKCICLVEIDGERWSCIEILARSVQAFRYCWSRIRDALEYIQPYIHGWVSMEAVNFAWEQ